MKKLWNFWVLGGDMRQAKLAQLLAADGHPVHVFALEQGAGSVSGLIFEEGLDTIGQADCVVLPLPVLYGESQLYSPLSQSHPPLDTVLDAIHHPCVVCGGRVDPLSAALAWKREIQIHDYFAREELAIANAVPTAEGAIQIAMEQLPITLHQASALILGFGRVGQVLAHRLDALGAQVTVAARRYEALAWAQVWGYRSTQLSQITDCLSQYDLIINTIPAPVLGEPQLEQLNPSCLLLDLASKPGGVDSNAAQRLGRTVLQALSLPGKVAPVTAGAAIQTAIYHMLQELGV